MSEDKYNRKGDDRVPSRDVGATPTWYTIGN